MGEPRHGRPRMPRHAMNRLLDAPQEEVDAVYRGMIGSGIGPCTGLAQPENRRASSAA